MVWTKLVCFWWTFGISDEGDLPSTIVLGFGPSPHPTDDTKIVREDDTVEDLVLFFLLRTSWHATCLRKATESPLTKKQTRKPERKTKKTCKTLEIPREPVRNRNVPKRFGPDGSLSQTNNRSHSFEPNTSSLQGGESGAAPLGINPLWSTSNINNHVHQSLLNDADLCS